MDDFLIAIAMQQKARFYSRIKQASKLESSASIRYQRYSYSRQPEQIGVQTEDDVRPYILFVPSPIAPILQSELSTFDVISLARVCRTWRAHLIPHLLETMEGKIQWHPLVKTLAAARLTPQQHKVCFVYRLMKGRPYEREESGHVPIFTGPDHGIDLKLFTRSFSGEIFAEEEQSDGRLLESGLSSTNDMVPPKLQTLMFWSIDGEVNGSRC
ncbi:uncharacterized protein DFL_000529 [Arthrobotrys flagrans]|uniref:F-box domain-containing protein n=1 Tax=Arthrobotrys flagrans TaxID=97331 RepID=A0A437AE13_ARTFL|nr:hypothetical protein DFL_000529 [Arthrobotrys flagrans]